MSDLPKGQDPIEAQGDGRQVSGRGVYIHDASGNRLEALNQAQADAFLQVGFRLATPEEATEYQKDVKGNYEEAKKGDDPTENPVIEARLTLSDQELEAELAARRARAEAMKPKQEEMPAAQTPQEAEEAAAKAADKTAKKETK